MDYKEIIIEFVGELNSIANDKIVARNPERCLKYFNVEFREDDLMIEFRLSYEESKSLNPYTILIKNLIYSPNISITVQKEQFYKQVWRELVRYSILSIDSEKPFKGIHGPIIIYSLKTLLIKDTVLGYAN